MPPKRQKERDSEHLAFYDVMMFASLGFGNFSIITEDGELFRLFKERNVYVIKKRERILATFDGLRTYRPSKNAWKSAVREIGRHLMQSVIAPLGLSLSVREVRKKSDREAVTLFLGMQVLILMAVTARNHFADFTREGVERGIVNIWPGNLAVSLWVRKGVETVMVVDLAGVHDAISHMNDGDRFRFLQCVVNHLREFNSRVFGSSTESPKLPEDF